jgi:hypothetical protein
MALWTWLITLVKGFIPIDGKRIGKIIWVLVLCTCAIGVYHKVFVAKTQTTNIAKIETQIINQCQPVKEDMLGFKFNLWKLHIKLGI